MKKNKLQKANGYIKFRETGTIVPVMGSETVEIYEVQNQKLRKAGNGHLIEFDVLVQKEIDALIKQGKIEGFEEKTKN